jgi:hypothetical protein
MLLSAGALLAAFALPTLEAAPSTPSATPAPYLASVLSAASWKTVSIGALQPDVFELALGAAACAVRSGSIDELATLTVIDYSRPSTEKRLWVFDMRTRALLFEELVAHGKGSGDNLARSFSNLADSHQSSLGLFRTGDTYVGRNGYSLRLEGLDDGFNDQAFNRAIVMHGAPYVSDAVATVQGRLGRSWGCPAVRQGIAREVIDTVKGNGLLFAYYPDRAWLHGSKYLACGAAPTAAPATLAKLAPAL